MCGKEFRRRRYGPSEAELQEALAVVQTYLEEQESGVGEEPSSGSPDSTATPSRPGRHATADEVLIIANDVTTEMYLSTRNLLHVDVIDTNEINPYALIGFDNVLLTKDAVEKVEAWLS